MTKLFVKDTVIVVVWHSKMRLPVKIVIHYVWLSRERSGIHCGLPDLLSWLCFIQTFRWLDLRQSHIPICIYANIMSNLYFIFKYDSILRWNLSGVTGVRTTSRYFGSDLAKRVRHWTIALAAPTGSKHDTFIVLLLIFWWFFSFAPHLKF